MNGRRRMPRSEKAWRALRSPALIVPTARRAPWGTVRIPRHSARPRLCLFQRAPCCASAGGRVALEGKAAVPIAASVISKRSDPWTAPAMLSRASIWPNAEAYAVDHAFRRRWLGTVDIDDECVRHRPPSPHPPVLSRLGTVAAERQPMKRPGEADCALQRRCPGALARDDR